MPSRRSLGQIQRTHRNCDKARNEHQKSLLLNELAKLQTKQMAELNAQWLTLLQQSGAIVKTLRNTRATASSLRYFRVTRDV
jgi:hypothetical protein